MANKRMFNNLVVGTDAFLDMPLSAQALYFHLNLRADDDGFVGNPKRVARDIGSNDDDLKILIAKRFVLEFEDGIIVIKHWRMHNTLSNNRYHETIFKDQKDMLLLKENNAYSLNSGSPIDDSHLIETSNRQSNKKIDGQKTDGRRTVDGQKTDPEVVVEVVVDKEEEKEKDNTTTCYCPVVSDEPIQTEQQKNVFITWKTNTNEDYVITFDYVDEMRELYPAVDVEQAFRNMKGWLMADPTRRKTEKGMKRFINNWLAKDQNQGGSKYYRNYTKSKIEEGGRESV